MRDIENTDRIIGEKAKSFEKTPPGEIWNGILDGIQPERKRLLPVFLRYAAGIAILLALGSGFYFIFRNHTENRMNELASGDKTEAGNQVTGPEHIENDMLPESGQEITGVTEENLQVVEKPEVNTFYAENEISRVSPQSETLHTEEQATVFTGEPSLIIAANFPGRLPIQLNPGDPERDRIREQNFDREYSWDDIRMLTDVSDEEKVTDRNFSLAAMLSPIYSYRDVSGTGMSQDYNDIEKGKLSYSGGMEFGIPASDRLSFQTGLVYSRMGYTIEGITNISSRGAIDWLNPKSTASSTQDLLVANSIGELTGTESSAGKTNFASYSNAPASQESDMLNTQLLSTRNDIILDDNLSIDQYLHFMEVPFNVNYKIIDRAVDLKLVGGLSTNFLLGSNVYLNSGGTTENIGQTSEIRRVNYSGNLGFGLDYDFRENLVFLFEPRFRYYLNSINSSVLVNSRPYSFGFFTGMRYYFR